METLVTERHLSPLHNHLHGPLSGTAYKKAMEDAQNGLLELQISREFSTRSGSELSTSSTDSRSSSLSPLSSPDISKERHFSTIMPSSERMQASKLMEVTTCMMLVLVLLVV